MKFSRVVAVIFLLATPVVITVLNETAEAYTGAFEAQPGAAPYPEQLRQQLQEAMQRKGSAYKPRTKYLRADGTALYANRLLLETSPYLLQHAHNPVNWYPWGQEAFAAAAKLGRPVFLSIGYSTCHWCHVMEEESFEDPEIARFLNEHYIAIKAAMWTLSSGAAPRSRAARSERHSCKCTDQGWRYCLNKAIAEQTPSS